MNDPIFEVILLVLLLGVFLYAVFTGPNLDCDVPDPEKHHKYWE